MRSLASLLLVLLVPLALAGEDTRPGPALCAGVKSIASVGSPGIVAVFGERAFPVVVGRLEGGVGAPVIAAAERGKGRLVACAHSGYLSPETLGKLDGPRFVENCVRWAAGRPAGAVRVGVLGRRPEFAGFLGARGFDVRELGSVRALATNAVDVLFACEGLRADADERAAIDRFLDAGGGLFVAETPWGWLQLNAGKALATDLPSQELLLSFGLAWVDGTVDATTPGGFTTGDVPELTHGGRALDFLLALRPDAKPKPETAAQIRFSVLAPLPMLPADEASYRPRLAQLRARAANVVPSAKAPVGDGDLAARIALALELEEALAAPVDAVRAHRAAEVFPGGVPRSAPRVSRSVTVDPRVGGWHSTGLYAAPGEIVELRAPRTGKNTRLTAQIGAHTDDLSHEARWSRCPRVVVKAPFQGGELRLSSPFGGLVYLATDGKDGEPVDVSITNAVEAPRFVLGQTEPREWRSRVRGLPAPWAELETRKVILTLPSRVVRELDDPAALMKFWDSVLDACADLGGRPRERRRPERYVTDEQISAGYMHSGYPIMTHLDVAPTFVDLARLQKNTDGCGWGFYHEMGHNHQEGAWTFEGTGEVTCNLFSVYVLDTVVGAEDGRTSAAECRKRFEEYRKDGTRYEKWKSDPFLALGFFLEIQRAFGWKPFQQFFAEHAALPAEERPKSDLEKRAQWLVRLSRLTERDLAPWFALWNVPVAPDAAAKTARWPRWIADGYPSN